MGIEAGLWEVPYVVATHATIATIVRVEQIVQHALYFYFGHTISTGAETLQGKRVSQRHISNRIGFKADFPALGVIQILTANHLIVQSATEACYVKIQRIICRPVGRERDGVPRMVCQFPLVARPNEVTFPTEPTCKIERILQLNACAVGVLHVSECRITEFAYAACSYQLIVVLHKVEIHAYHTCHTRFGSSGFERIVVAKFIVKETFRFGHSRCISIRFKEIGACRFTVCHSKRGSQLVSTIEILQACFGIKEMVHTCHFQWCVGVFVGTRHTIIDEPVLQILVERQTFTASLEQVLIETRKEIGIGLNTQSKVRIRFV